ncbi:hypothetical protein DPX16_4753 [Anabarilius grahami]|uniref:Uncharacterized protein n=1 Tax=Anabarilius grahami TaxID=495550 RepID=A0A3N0YI75_ANAGA|nr:hypothetical protein DPX16_4753 [Anabarilius grahami]
MDILDDMGPIRHVESASESVRPSDHSDWLFSYCHLLIWKGISSYAGTEQTCYLAVDYRASVWCVRATLDPDAADVSQPLKARTHQANADELVATKADCGVGSRRQRLCPKLP